MNHPQTETKKSHSNSAISSIKIEKNESMKSFRLRLQKTTTEQMGKANSEAESIRPARKAFLKRFKTKNKPQAENSHLESSLKKQSKVAFGDVALEPPLITKFPKIKARSISPFS